MNLIPMIREQLGLDENEEFKIKYYTNEISGNRFRFTKKKLEEHFDNGWFETRSLSNLNGLIHNEYFVVKLPFKPNENETYYFVHLENGDVYRTDYRPANKSDRVKVNSGNCYKTVEEAENHVDEWMTKVYGNDWKELMK